MERPAKLKKKKRKSENIIVNKESLVLSDTENDGNTARSYLDPEDEPPNENIDISTSELTHFSIEFFRIIMKFGFLISVCYVQNVQKKNR